MNKLIVTINNIKDIDVYNKFDNIKRYIIGEKKYGLRLNEDYNIEEINKILKSVHDANKEIYIAINKLFKENEIADLKEYIKSLINYDIDGIIFSDFAVYEIIKELNFKINLTYSTDTTITNISFSTLANEQGINDIFLAKELTFKEISEINEKKNTPIAMFIHGHIYMYNTFRELLTNYSKHVNKELDFNNNFYLYDGERNNYYPIVQTKNQTNIMSADDQASIRELKNILDCNIDYLIIDGFLYKDEDYIYVLAVYNHLINLYNSLDFTKDENLNLFEEECKKKLSEMKKKISYKKFSNGFLKKETIF